MSGEMEEILQDFIVETTEILDGLDEKFVALEKDHNNKDLINDIFRAVHTIKGAAGFLGFTQMVELSHAAENVLKKLRDGIIETTPEIMDVIFSSIDKLKVLLEKIKNNDDSEEDISDILNNLKAIDDGHFTQENSTAKSNETDNSVKNTSDETNTNLLHSKEQLQLDKTIRVDIKRLDTVFNLVGELVLGKNRLLKITSLLEEKYQSDPLISDLIETSEFLQLISTELQMAVMKTRMQPVKKVFSRFPRLVRDLARSHGKEVELIIKGEDTEVDKSVIENIADPLVHLIRNAIDHGIEPPDERESQNKPRTGRIVLSAAQEGNNIVIFVIDDGRGIDVEKIKKKAIEKGLITQKRADVMSKKELLDLIFVPGFSTATQVNDVSGRGVGMDVVKTNLSKINGTIEIFTQPGKGTRFTIKLPLTLAIIQTLMVMVEDMVFAVPLTSVIETVMIESGEISTVDTQEVIKLRGEILPIIRLAELLGITCNKGYKDRHYVVVVQSGEIKFGIVVDRLIGQEEVVIKAIEGDIIKFVDSNIFAGATITGEGKVVLIIDIAEAVQSFKMGIECYV